MDGRINRWPEHLSVCPSITNFMENIVVQYVKARSFWDGPHSIGSNSVKKHVAQMFPKNIHETVLKTGRLDLCWQHCPH